jgi:hypothetical protein
MPTSQTWHTCVNAFGKEALTDDDFAAAALVVILAKQLEAEAKQAGETVAVDYTAQAVKLIHAKQVTIKRQLREATHW